MKNAKHIRSQLKFAEWLVGLTMLVSASTHAATTDLASAPLSSSTSSVVHPNILLTLDDSGSMAWNYVPDYTGGTSNGGSVENHCKPSQSCNNGMTPFQTNHYNGMAYDPTVSYVLPINADGFTFKPTQNSTNTSGWTAVKVDGYGVQSTSNINMTAGFPEVHYCSSGAVCKQNGIDTNNPFFLRPSVSADNPPIYAYPGTLTGTAFAFNGLLNQAATTSGTIINGTLNVYHPAVISSLTLNSMSKTVVGGNNVVTVNYTAVSPALATGDKVVVAGTTSNCSSGFKSGGGSLSITVVNATTFTYISTTGGGTWSKTNCSITATKAAVPATAPSFSKTGSTVTVTLASAPTPALPVLPSSSLVTIANGAGTCDVAFKATSVALTYISPTSFSYTAPNSTAPTSGTSCNITQVITAPPVSPGISLSGTTVTVYYTNHGMVNGDKIQISNGTSGTCSNGFTTSAAVTVSNVTANTFTYTPPVGAVTTSSNCKFVQTSTPTSVAYTSASTMNANPYYFVIIPTEYCDSLYLTNCKALTAPQVVLGVNYSFPAYTRFCTTDTVAALPPGDPGAQGGKCQGKYSFATATTYMSVRYGLFWRGDIVPTKATYGNENYSGTSTTGGVSLTYANTLVIDRSKRADCASPPNCTYAEEMTNFSNWYAYYHTRIQMMKSAAGQAFATLNNQYRVGFVTINPTASKYIPVDDFYDDSTISYAQRTNWYSTLYSIKPNSSTPLREGLANAGLYFAGLKPGVMTDDPIQYSCQQNFSIVTTDGFWNGTDANVHDLNGHTMGNFDNVNSGASSRSFGAYDGGVAGATDTLADVAMYYYKTDLRTSALGNCPGALNSSPTTGVAEWGVCENNVPMTAADTAAGLVGTQHMVTFTLGLSDGLLTYQPDYATASSGDFYRIKTAATGCSFSGSGTCNWPLPLHDSSTALDDLWHAAVNGRGVFYQARDPVSLSAGLVGALTGIGVHTAAAAASSTSSPNITQTDNYIFSSTYRTGKWDGEVVAQQLDVTTGNVIGSYTVKTSPPCPTPFFGSCTLPYVWSAQAQLDTLVQSDTTPDKSAKRIIYTYDNASVTGNPVKDFLYGSLTAAEQAYFDGHCSTGSALPQLSQCSSGILSATTEMPLANSGLNLVNWLRGNQSLEPDIYRPREHILGDTVNAKPSFVKFPLYSFSDTVSPTYSAFKAAITSLPRQGVLYMGTNDGMLHAFNSDTGAEMWGYLPKIVMPNLYKLADVAYPNNHQYYVDGSPETMDVFVDSLTATANSLSAGWHTILVGGLGLGGRGYYALDVTDPASPIALWEICSDIVLCPTVGTTVYADPDIGYSYGNPVITKRSTDGKWVVLVTSGYNNVNSGSTSGQGVLFELDALSGEILSKTFTGSGSSANPSGLAKISPWINSFFTNNQTRYVYGGDLNGDVWRFDLGEVGSTGNPTVTQIASVKDAAGVAQSITTRPVLGDPMHNTLDTLSFKAADINKQPKGNPAVFIATGRYVGLSDVGNEQMQTVYAIKDDLSKTGTAAYIGNPRAPNAGFGSFVKQYILQPGGVGTPRTTTTTPVTWSTNQGWYADLALYSGSTSGTPVLTGERVNIDPQLVVGTLIVVSNIPQSSACTTGGTSWLYSFDFLTGQYVASEGNTNVAVYLGNALSVGIVVVSLPSGPLKAIVTSADSTKTTETPTLKGNGSTTRASWRELMQ